MQPSVPVPEVNPDEANGRVVRPGDVIDGRYRVLQLLADGGMGTVFLAEHVLIKRRVAIKVLHSELVADTDMVKRFMNEALAAGTLGHPHIVESTDMGFTQGGIPFIVFEYLEGILLTEEVYRTGGLSVRRALRLAIQIASALEAAHNAGIVHLDLKPDNVFLTDKKDDADHVKVLDFGISRFMEPDVNQTQRGLFIGTPEFMAPEQIEAPETVDKRADIYALGVVLYEMLCARRPYSVNDPRLLLHQICNEPPPPLTCQVPRELEQLLFGRLLAKDRNDRLQSMQEVQNELENIWQRVRSVDSIPPPSAREVSLFVADDAARSPRLPTAAEPITLPSLPKRAPWGWLVAALVSGAACGAFWYADKRSVTSTRDMSVAALRVDAEKLGDTLAAGLRAARLRVESIASGPMTRSAIETDANTVRDMARSESLFTPAEHEVLELFQLRDGVQTSFQRFPEGASLPDGATIEDISPGEGRIVRGAGSAVFAVVSQPVMRRRGGVGGALLLSVRVELSLVQQLLAQDVLSARLVGLGAPLDLLPPTTAQGATIVMSVPAEHGLVGKLQLTATVRDVSRNPAFRGVTVAAAGTGGLCLLLFAFGSRHRRRVVV